MKWMLVALAVLLAGCTTYSDLKDRPADYTATTQKPPRAYLECVVPKWIDQYAGAHIITDNGDLVLVAPVGGGTPSVVAMTLSATPSGETTRVEMKHMPAANSFADQWRQAQSCL